MKIDLLGTSFTLQSDEDPAYLEEVVSFYRDKLEEIDGSVATKDPVKLAILAGILVADELFKNQQPTAAAAGSALPPGTSGSNPKEREELEEAERITLQLIETIASSLEDAALETTEPL